MNILIFGLYTLYRWDLNQQHECNVQSVHTKSKSFNVGLCAATTSQESDVGPVGSMYRI